MDIVCPNCGKSVALNQVIRHQIEDKIRKELKAENTQELDQLKISLREEAIKKAREQFDLRTKTLEEENKEAKEQTKELKENLLNLTRELRFLQTKDEQRELEMQKKLLEERGKIQKEAEQTEREKFELEKLRYEKQLEDTKKALEEAKRKADQKSQQLQGEVLEINLENQLRSFFPTDEILGVPKGIEGADIWQKVKNRLGQTAGSILWETKRTKAWSNSWTAKLREDKRTIGASLAVLVSDILPQDIQSFEFYDRVWVSNRKYAAALAGVLRHLILETAIAKSAASHKDTKLQEIYDYIVSDAFKYKIEAHFESVKALREDLDSEKRVMERNWKRREIQIQRLDRSMSQMFGEIQGIAGAGLKAPDSLGLGSSNDALATREEQLI